MRKQLRALDQIRKTFRGVFEREGKKINWNGYSEPTILLRDITDETGRTVADHLWFSKTKSFEALGALSKGDLLEFEARVTSYVKGYANAKYKINDRKTDFKLSRPTKVKKIKPVGDQGQ